MSSPLTTVVAVAASVLLALGFLFVLRRRWTPTKLREVNDATVFYISVSGTIYAVVVAFMLSSVWEAFHGSQVNAGHEADALVGVFRLAGGFPDPARAELREALRTYAEAVPREEWPAMERGGVSRRAAGSAERAWQAALQIRPADAAQQVALDHALTELTKMAERREVRLVQSRTRLPGILWVVLILGGLITVGTSCLLGVESPRLHALYVVSLTCLVSLTLVAIAEIDRPFGGTVRVAPDSFEMALATVNGLQGK